MALPTYEETVNNLDKLFDPSNPKQAALVESIRKATEKDPEVLKKLAKDIFNGKAGEDLVKSVEATKPIINNVKHSFVTIGATLASVDSKKIVIEKVAIRTFYTACEDVRKDPQGNDVKVKLPGWKDLTETFDGIMKESQQVAARAAATAKQFSHTLISVLLDSDTTKTEAHEILAVYKKNVNKEKEDAQMIGTKLTQLHQDIVNFQGELKKLDKDNNIKKEIADVERQISDLDARIKKLDKLIDGCIWSGLGAGIGFFVGAVLCLTPLAPVGVGLMVLSGGAAIGAGIAGGAVFGKEMDEARNQRKQKKDELDKLVQTQKDLVEVQGKLSQLKTDWDTITQGLIAISQLWGTFAESLAEIEESIKKTDENLNYEGKIWQKTYLLDLQLLQAVWMRTSQMLEQWAANITAVYDPEHSEPAPPYKP